MKRSLIRYFLPAAGIAASVLISLRNGIPMGWTQADIVLELAEDGTSSAPAGASAEKTAGEKTESAENDAKAPVYETGETDELSAGFSAFQREELRELIREELRKEEARLLVLSEAGGKGLVDLNTAEKEELMTLNGIGEARAEAILQYREEHGPFSEIREIMNVSGIKESAFEKIKDSIFV